MIGFIELLAIALPVAGCLFLGFRLWKHDKGSWQMLTCFSGLLIATSLLLLAAVGKVSFLSVGDAALQMNQNLEETKLLTEQNRRIAKATAEVSILLARPMTAAAQDRLEDWLEIRTKAEVLLREAGVDNELIKQKLVRIDRYIEILKTRPSE